MARSIKEVHTINYYPINEGAARRAKEMNSFSDYKEGSATAEYRAMVDKAAAIAEKQKSRVDPMYHEKIDHLLDTYARKLAELADEYEFRAKGMQGDVAFYRDQTQSTGKRLKNLEQLHRINQMTMARRKPPKPPEQSELDKLIKRIRSTSRFRPKHVCRID